MWIALQIGIILLGPWAILTGLRQVKSGDWLSPVVLAYLLGILLVSLRLFPLDESISETATEVSILLAIPLLLFSSNLRKWLSHAGKTVLSFVLCILAGTISALMITGLMHASIPEVSQLAGMLVGVYTGGTPNMQAIGLALGASEERFILLNATDLLWSGFYLIFLTSVGAKWLGKFLPKYQYGQSTASDMLAPEKLHWQPIVISIFLAAIIVGTSLGTTFLIFKALAPVAFIILMLTTLSVAASFIPKINGLHGAYETGEYLLLVFCIAIGMRSDFRELLNNSGTIVLFTGMVMTASILLHYFLSWLFKIDRDTTMITSTAAIFGPAFIGQIASVLNNREIVFAGVATGLAGYAVGNYLGIAVAYLLEYILVH